MKYVVKKQETEYEPQANRSSISEVYVIYKEQDTKDINDNDVKILVEYGRTTLDELNRQKLECEKLLIDIDAQISAIKGVVDEQIK